MSVPELPAKSTMQDRGFFVWDPERPRAENIHKLSFALIRYKADAWAVGALWATGEGYYPFDEHAAEFSAVLAPYEGLFFEETVRAVAEGLDEQNVEETRVFRMLLTGYLEVWTKERWQQIEESRGRPDGPWQIAMRAAVAAEDITAVLVTEDGEHEILWQAYERFRSTYVRGEIKGDLAQATRVFDAGERIAGEEEAGAILETVRHIRTLGFSIDEFLTIMLGESPFVLENRADDLLALMEAKIPKDERRPLFIKRQQEALEGYNLTIRRPEPNDAVRKSVRFLGITEAEWESLVEIVPSVPEVHNALYYLVLAQPNHARPHTPGPAWDALMNKWVVLAAPVGDITIDQHRLYFHEPGHAIHAVLRIVADLQAGDPIPGKRMLGLPMPLNEIFSMFHEGLLPDQAYVRLRDRFLAARFAALTKHESTLWRLADEAVDQGNTPEAKERLLSAAYRSYQETVGDVFQSAAPTGRALRDFFSPSTPGVTSSYAIGMALAAVVRKQVDAAHTPQDRRAVLSRWDEAIAASDRVEDVLTSLDTTWQDAVEAMVALYWS